MSRTVLKQQDVQLLKLENDAGQKCEFGIKIQAKNSDQQLADLSVAWLRELVEQYQLVVLSGFQSENSAESITQFSASIGQIMMWPFGAVLELVEQPDAVDHIFASSYVPLHWDGMYLAHVPELQVFQCVSQIDATAGGRTTFSNTLVALQNATIETKQLWENSKAQYQRQVELYGSTVEAPIIEQHPYNGKKVLRFCEPPKENDADFLNPSIYKFMTPSKDISSAELVQSLRRALYDPAAHYAHTWQKGDVVIADNFSLLHGRESFKSQSGRHVRRVHIHAKEMFKNPHLVEQA